MNLKRRKLIDQARELMGQAQTLLETARDEEQDYYDNMPESFQGAERGERAQAWIDALDTVITNIEGDVDTLSDDPA